MKSGLQKKGNNLDFEDKKYIPFQLLYATVFGRFWKTVHRCGCSTERAMHEPPIRRKGQLQGSMSSLGVLAERSVEIKPTFFTLQQKPTQLMTLTRPGGNNCDERAIR